MAVRQDWKHDEIININLDDPSHRDMLWRRFKNMMDRGCTLFYLDSFGSEFEDVKLMRSLRQKLGPDILTFAEHQCDALLPYSGGYSGTTLDAEANPPHYFLWSGVSQWEIYRWLVPGAQMASRLYQVKGKASAGFKSPDEFFYENQVTPLLPASDFSRLPAIKGIQRKYLTAERQWR
jgi:hypothetical protein